MQVMNPPLRIGDIVRIIQPNFARLNTRWYDRREQQLIRYCVGRRAQVRSIYEYSNEGKYIPEYKLKLYRKHNSDAMYTLF